MFPLRSDRQWRGVTKTVCSGTALGCSFNMCHIRLSATKSKSCTDTEIEQHALKVACLQNEDLEFQKYDFEADVAAPVEM